MVRVRLFSQLCLGVASQLANVRQLAWMLDCRSEVRTRGSTLLLGQSIQGFLWTLREQNALNLHMPRAHSGTPDLICEHTPRPLDVQYEYPAYTVSASLSLLYHHALRCIGSTSCLIMINGQDAGMVSMVRWWEHFQLIIGPEIRLHQGDCESYWLDESYGLE